ncbi:NUDIX hydrolase [Bacillus sp. SD088]|uniref:NUDIX hydrolase n=1 Tax=Bacillus sp. SD088 TaxID=2782012 RepID=UPI001A97B491|nr:NUDIX hydrolase [Bacillus sp. SD088]MBO0992758.1 NUDIX hydrolase [Bacillus sp. SD088]
MSNSKCHRTFGVYGIYEEAGKLLFIRKNMGPYANRFDLPGGRLEDGETLLEAMRREFLEETGLEIKVEKNIGTIDFKLPWLWSGFAGVHHIAVYYSVRRMDGKIRVPEHFAGQDSLGAVWVTEKDVSLDNASPLVLKAFEWLKTKNLGLDAEIYEEWKVIK